MVYVAQIILRLIVELSKTCLTKKVTKAFSACRVFNPFSTCIRNNINGTLQPSANVDVQNHFHIQPSEQAGCIKVVSKTDQSVMACLGFRSIYPGGVTTKFFGYPKGTPCKVIQPKLQCWNSGFVRPSLNCPPGCRYSPGPNPPTCTNLGGIYNFNHLAVPRTANCGTTGTSTSDSGCIPSLGGCY